MLIEQEMGGTLEIDDMKLLCDKWNIGYEMHPTTRTLRLAKALGPIDPDKLPSRLEARQDVQRLIHTYMRQAQTIIQILWDEEE